MSEAPQPAKARPAGEPVVGTDSAGELQHPRRNLGNRCRAQAERFIKLADKDPERAQESLEWAEQNARQAILHDFTDENNWRILAHVKVLREDGAGLSLVLDDAFTVLGRDPERLAQLEGIDMLSHGYELLSAAFVNDPLDPDIWLQAMLDGGGSSLIEFGARCRRLDFRDQRANIIFGRRLERILSTGQEEMFISLVRHLLAHRPTNHELWSMLATVHERRKEWEDAWLCHDHVQQIRPTSGARDAFRERLTARMDGTVWKEPDEDARSIFLRSMQKLAQKVSKPVEMAETPVDEDRPETDPEEVELKRLLESNDHAAAFFMARRLVTTGQDWAIPYMEQAKEGLN